MFTWDFSDLHCGMPSNYSAFHRFLDEVDRQRPDLLIGNGDVLELVWYTFEHCMSWKPSRDAIDHLRDVASCVPTLLLPGNHDLDLWKYNRELSPIRIISTDSYTSDDGVLYIHGHQFDPVYKSTWAWINRLPFARKVAPCISERLYGTPYELKSQGRDESYGRLTGLIEAGVVLYGAPAIVFGHTHSECIRYRRDSWAANSGDFTDSCSTLKVIDGNPSMEWFKAVI